MKKLAEADYGPSQTFSGKECSMLRHIIMKAQGMDLPLAWEDAEMKALVERLYPTTYSVVMEERLR